MTTEAKPVLNSRDAARQLGAALHKLIELVETESRDDGMRDAAAMDALLAEKRAAAQDYRELLQEITANPETAGGFDQAERTQLKTAARRLDSATQTNARVLKAKLDANNALMQSVSKAAQKSQGGDSSYQDSGRVAEFPADGPPAAVLVSETA